MIAQSLLVNKRQVSDAHRHFSCVSLVSSDILTSQIHPSAQWLSRRLSGEAVTCPYNDCPAFALVASVPVTLTKPI